MPGSVGGPIRDRLEVISGKRVGHEIGLCYNPEFIALGNVIEGLLRPDFVLIGESDARAGGLLEKICRRIVGPSLLFADTGGTARQQGLLYRRRDGRGCGRGRVIPTLGSRCILDIEAVVNTAPP
jgi:hypothetical protein